MISLEKLKILTLFQKLPKNVFKYEPHPAFLVYFCPCLDTMTNVVPKFDYKWKKSRKCAWDLNLRLQMVGADESTEL